MQGNAVLPENRTAFCVREENENEEENEEVDVVLEELKKKDEKTD